MYTFFYLYGTLKMEVIMDKNIIIRAVKPEDAEQYIKLNNLVWRSAYKDIFPEDVFVNREKDIDKKIEKFPTYSYNDDNQMIYVAEDNGVIVGFVSSKIKSNYPHFAELEYAEIGAMYIHPDYQGLGIASKFKNIFEKWAKERNATKYVIGVLRDNLKARKVYENWGGKLDNYIKQYEISGKGTFVL